METESGGHGATQKIAGQDACSVSRCPCGCVHVHIGMFTVRLRADAFLDLATVIAEAAATVTQDVPGGQRH